MPDDDATRAALAIMTAWASEDSVDFAAETAANYTVDPDMGDERLVTGFINLMGLTLTMIEGEYRQSPERTLRWLASRPWNQR